MAQDPFEAHLQEADRLFAAGEVAKAGRIWQGILKQDPQHARARLALAKVQQHLEAAGTPPDPEEVENLVRQGATLYDMGVLEEAVAKWQKALELDPDSTLARSYLELAEKERMERATTAMPQMAPPPPTEAPSLLSSSTTPMATHALDPRLAQAEHLLEIGRLEEAAFAFQMILAKDPQHPQALRGLALALPESAPSASGPIGLAETPAPPALALALPATVIAAPPRRAGPDLPPPVRALLSSPWLRSPWAVAGLLGGIVLGALGLYAWTLSRRERQLRREVAAARSAAQGPVAQAAAIADLQETDADILAEAQGALGEDPVRAYHRAKELLRRDAANGAAAQLLERAKGALGANPVPASPEVFAAKLRAGDLDAADRELDGLLRAAPEDPALLRREERLLETLAQLRASNHDWRGAREALSRGRALFPLDKTWAARLRLLARMESLPSNERAGWVAFL